MTALISPITSGTTSEYVRVRIKESKTDPFRLGHTITVGATHTEVCAVQALHNYMLLHPATIGPLLIFASKKNLFQNKFCLSKHKSCSITSVLIRQIMQVTATESVLPQQQLNESYLHG